MQNGYRNIYSSEALWLGKIIFENMKSKDLDVQFRYHLQLDV